MLHFAAFAIRLLFLVISGSADRIATLPEAHGDHRRLRRSAPGLVEITHQDLDILGQPVAEVVISSAKRSGWDWLLHPHLLSLLFESKTLPSCKPFDCARDTDGHGGGGYP